MGFKSTRKDYSKYELLEADCPATPHELLHRWLEEAHRESEDANAFVLGTVARNGKPSGRVVLLRGLDERGFTFYTNYTSRKALAMEANARVSATFFWPWMERQVRAEGAVEKLSAAESDLYFASRPRESQIGAWASPQSATLASREELESQVAAITIRFEGREIPRPEHWGGYLVRLDYVEFWQGRPSRLHDRLIYTLANGRWSLVRLAP